MSLDSNVFLVSSGAQGGRSLLRVTGPTGTNVVIGEGFPFLLLP